MADKRVRSSMFGVCGRATVACLMMAATSACSSESSRADGEGMPEDDAVSRANETPVACKRDIDCERGFVCDTNAGECIADDEHCMPQPSALSDEFDMREEWSWTGDAEVLPDHEQVMMTPIVANLTDDNGDGRIDERDVPDVMFHTFAGSNYLNNGVLRAVSGDIGARVWPSADPGYRTLPISQLAVADVSPDSPGPEIVACEVQVGQTPERSLIILASDGSVFHRFRDAPNQIECAVASQPSVGDMDGDGMPEIVEGLSIAHGDGTVVRKIDGPEARSVLANIDDDEDLELVTPRGAYNYDGSPVWEATDDRPPAGFLAVADLDADPANPAPEIVVTFAREHEMWVLEGATGEVRWSGKDINPAGTTPSEPFGGLQGGGAPLLANLDEDAALEIGVAGGFAYATFDHGGVEIWNRAAMDLSSRTTGASAFDFDGDGFAEVLYSDERNFRVFRGSKGEELVKRCNTSGTVSEFPIVADIDNDASAEIVLAENNFAFNFCEDGTPSSHGIHVFGDPDDAWPSARRIFNQFSYHITNINEDGTVPRREKPHWASPRTNSYRQNIVAGCE